METHGAEILVTTFTARAEQPRARSRVNVLFLMTTMAMGGAERLVLNLVARLDRRVFAPAVGYFQPEQPLKEFKELGIPLYYLPKSGRVDFGTMSRLAQIIARNNIDIVNAHHFMPFFYSYYGAKVANRVRLVYTDHSEADVLRAAGKWKIIGPYLIKSSDGAIGISDRVTRTLISHFRLDPRYVHTIANGVESRITDYSDDLRTRLRNELGLDADDVLIAHVANFKRNKNHVFLLKALREIGQRRPNVKLIVVGQGYPGDVENSQNDVVDYIRNSGLSSTVRLLGYRPDVQDLLVAADLCCLVSYREGLPLSLLEAMANGLPVIGTDVEGIRDVIEPDVNGLLVRPDDVPQLAAALSRLAGDRELRLRMGQRSRDLATEKYALKRCVEQTQQLFLSLVPKHVSAL